MIVDNQIEKLDLEKLKAILQKENIFDLLTEKRYGVFGSFARNEEFNDIDLMIENPINISEIYKFKQRLKRKYKINLDFLIKEFSDPIILSSATKDLIYVEQFKI